MQRLERENNAGILRGQLAELFLGALKDSTWNSYDTALKSYLTSKVTSNFWSP